MVMLQYTRTLDKKNPLTLHFQQNANPDAMRLFILC